jgi:hypothetical protein
MPVLEPHAQAPLNNVPVTASPTTMPRSFTGKGYDEGAHGARARKHGDVAFARSVLAELRLCADHVRVSTAADDEAEPKSPSVYRA